jgi:hypothetical protein
MKTRPIFNVLIPFSGYTTIQMNVEMAAAISNYLFEFENAASEIYALAEALQDYGSFTRKASSTAFSVDIFGHMVVLHMNSEMRDLLKSYLDDLESDDSEDDQLSILRAMKHAVNDPTRAYEMYVKKHKRRSNNRSNHNDDNANEQPIDSDIC